LDLELEDAGWLSRHFSTLPVEEAATLYAGAVRLDTPAKRAMLVGSIDLSPLAKSPSGLEFLKGIALDALLAAQIRYDALAYAGEAGKAWFDWSQLAEADDPIVEFALKQNLTDWMPNFSRAEQDRFLGALAKSRIPALRAKRLEIYPQERADNVQVLLDALTDSSADVQLKAVEILTRLREAQEPALYVRLLSLPAAKGFKRLYQKASAYDDPQIIEKLVERLDDPDPMVRELALGALKTMRETMETKKEWRAILKAVKEERKQ